MAEIIEFDPSPGDGFDDPSKDGGDDTEQRLNPFVVDLQGFEGPIDVLLQLARDQKVDLIHISILELADQYLAFVAEARKHNLELAADYLVMAAWLAFLKSRLLLPDLSTEEEPSGEAMAAALQYQLMRLQAMQNAGQGLMARPRLGQDFVGRGNPERFKPREVEILDATLYDLLKAYADQQRRKNAHAPMQIEAFEIYTVEDALQRLRRLVGMTPDWQDLWSFLPENLKGVLLTRSAVASTFVASLEMAKEGKLLLRQSSSFGPIYLQGRANTSDQSEPE
ncbi:MAG: segregation/condensation protein A [Rhodospirillales bacterium]|jgi:segregation and condensation protein A|nr:segregation/condensation protein A [Rhodospirillales bacterium]